MALDGGGGGGLVGVSNSFTGSAQSLARVVPGWWYGYSNTGLITNASGETTLFEFTASVSLKLIWSPGVNLVTLSQSEKTFGFRFYLDGAVAWAMMSKSSFNAPEKEQAPLYDKMFIVPRYTQVKITAQTSDDGGSIFYGAISGEELE